MAPPACAFVPSPDNFQRPHDSAVVEFYLFESMFAIKTIVGGQKNPSAEADGLKVLNRQTITDAGAAGHSGTPR